MHGSIYRGQCMYDGAFRGYHINKEIILLETSVGDKSPCQAICHCLIPRPWRNGLATSASSNCYFRCQKFGSTFRTLSHENSKTQLHHALDCCSHAHSISI